jgi:hypothetical protein
MDALVAWGRDCSQNPQAAKGGVVEDEVWLLGQPPLSKFVEYIEDTAKTGRQQSRSEIVDAWRTANDYYAELERTEAGIADACEICDLDASLQPLADDVMADPRWARGFDLLPTRIAFVELDRLVVSQPHVNLRHAEGLKQALGRAPAPEAVFRFCLPLDRDEASVQVRRAGANRFLFWSRSSDFRFHESVLLDPAQIQDHHAFGPVARVLGLLVGYGSNFLNVIQADGRLLLHNGYHRAYALRDAGLTHAPCIVQTVTRRDELNLVASRTVLDDPGFYLKAARPPLLKDFFDPRIRTVLQVPQLARVIELSFQVKEFETADFASVE